MASTAAAMARPMTPDRLATSLEAGSAAAVKHSISSLVGISGGQPGVPAAI